MSTQINKYLFDNQLLINGGASTVLGAAQAKGTATDLHLAVIPGPLGPAAIGGTVSVFVRGSNVTSTALTNWTAVTADKGTLPASYTTTGNTVLHFQNLQFAFYRAELQGTATSDVRTVYNFFPPADSFDAT